MATDVLSTVEYPESDGQPMGESDLHRDCMYRVIELLKSHVAGQRIYVTGNLHLYYREGDPRQMVCPDAMVVKDCDPRRRRTYKLWEEKRTPCFVLETTSDSTRDVDQGLKRDLYAILRVAEYFLFDPTGDYLPEFLVGYRLTPRGYERISADAEGAVISKELGLKLQVIDEVLELFSLETRERLLTGVEQAAVAQEKLIAAMVFAAAAEQEIARLRAELARRPPPAP